MKTRIRRTTQLLLITLIIILTNMPLTTVLAQAETPNIHITQVDNSNFPDVTVYVSVTNAAGEPMAIDPSQLQLSENGKSMRAKDTSAAGDIGDLTTMLVMDVSGSMLQAGKLRGAKQAALSYIQQMRPSDKAGLITFNTVVKYVQPLTNDRDALTTAINNLNAYEDTAMFDALTKAIQLLKDEPGRKAIIVLTDGLDNVSKNTPAQVLKAMEPNGLSISTIGLGDPKKSGVNSGLDEKSLQKFSEQAGGIYSYANDPDTLKSLYQQYGRTLQSEYRILYTSPSRLRDGTNRSLSITLQRTSGMISSTIAEYNSGGVLPEASKSLTWPIFGALLTGLLILLFAPLIRGTLLSRQVASSAAVTPTPEKKPKIKLK